MATRSPSDDEEQLLVNTSVVRSTHSRLWVYLGSSLLLGAVGLGGRAALRSSSVVDEVVTLHGYPWISAWPLRGARFDANGCTWDGDDCRASRCCAKPGSSCYLKNSRWASCNETCHVHRKWGAGRDGHGVWSVTSYPVWDCTDITRQVVVKTTDAPKTTEQTTAAPATTALPDPTTQQSTTPKSTEAPFQWSVSDTEPQDDQTVTYPVSGDEAVPLRAHTEPATASSSDLPLPNVRFTDE